MTEIRTGTDALRQAVFVWSRKGHLARLAQDLALGVNALDEFSRGNANLPADVKTRLAPMMYPNSEYDAKLDLLRKAHKEEPRSLGIRPEPLDPKTLPTYRAGPPQAAPRMVTPLPQPPKRPGGATVMRQMLAARNKKFNLAPLAGDLSISSGALEDFAYGRAGLAPEVLVALAKVLFEGNAEYDPAIDELRPVKREEPRLLGVHPPPITEMMTLPVYQAGPAPPSPGMVTPAKPKVRRAGWVE